MNIVYACIFIFIGFSFAFVCMAICMAAGRDKYVNSCERDYYKSQFQRIVRDLGSGNDKDAFDACMESVETINMVIPDDTMEDDRK